MSTAFISRTWALKEVEAIEEQLEDLKLAAFAPKMVRSRLENVVESTAGLLGKKIPSGTVYKRRLRRDWERQSRRRTA